MNVAPAESREVESIHWPEPVKRAVIAGDVAATGIELLNMGAGFALVPTVDKKPIMHLADRTGSRTGKRPETADPVVWQQWCAVWSDIGLGVVPGSGFAVIDDDRGDLDPRNYGLLGTYSERTRRGTHVWAKLPLGSTARSAKLPGGGGDILTGGSYVISSPTPPYLPIDLDAPILTVPDDSPLWKFVRPQRPLIQVAIPTMTQWHRTQATTVIANLMLAPPDIARDVRALLAGQVPDDATPSEADYRLALMATFHTSDPGIIAAVMCNSGLKREKYLRSDYLPRQIGAALSRRQELVSTTPGALTVSYVAAMFPDGNLPTVSDAILRVLASQNRDIDDGWTRVPVQAVATTCRVHRATVWRVIDRLEFGGDIEAVVNTVHRNGRPVRERWARLAESERILP